MSCIPGGNPLRRFPNITWPAKSKQQWIEWFRNCDEKQVEWRAPWFSVIRPSICRANNEPWVYLMGLWGTITYSPLLVLRQYDIEQFIPLTHGLDSLEVSFDNKSVTDKMRRLAHDWKNAEYKRLYLPVASESSTRSYKDWHRDRVKDLVLPPEKDPHYPADPDSLDELTHLKYEVSRLREGVELKEMGEKYELAKTALSQELDQVFDMNLGLMSDLGKEQLERTLLQKKHDELKRKHASLLKTTSFFRNDSGKMKTNWLSEKKRKLTFLDADRRVITWKKQGEKSEAEREQAQAKLEAEKEKNQTIQIENTRANIRIQ
ncbi:hypothetical protein COLO4_37634 [Corchorus olitorius]|uniref:DUF7745 domain-containing protein n=1 Tax=Corchorus olitorius TaxID=93759 RepID=A0A1R3G0B3_9ROSI|nr:hypothetical protein COLO4_37634 [Corchorus olitorius]